VTNRLKFTIGLIVYLTLQAIFFSGVIPSFVPGDIHTNPIPYLMIGMLSSSVAIILVLIVMKADE
jgi:hypothetical protein